ncbi:MAG: Ig-like domain-containing protein, partial [Gammaproteobacteria bacterium]
VDVVFIPGTAPTLASIAVTPANPTIQTSATQQFTATGTYSDSSTQNITTQVTWASSNTAVATINSAGLATAGTGAGTTTISATSGAVSGNTTLTVQTAPPITSTGLLAPGANAAVTSSAGDNNGFQTTPSNAYVTDGLLAVDTNSGTNTNTSCTNAGKDKHNYYNYNFIVPSGVAIRGIEVRLAARADSAANSPRMCAQLSWNGGASWTTALSTTTLSTATTTYILGGATNTWGRTWTVGDFSNANFRVRIIDIASSTARDFSLDGVAVQVTYQ